MISNHCIYKANKYFILNPHVFIVNDGTCLHLQNPTHPTTMPGVGGGCTKPRFSAWYVGSCSLQPEYTSSDLNQAVAQLKEVNTQPVRVALELGGGRVLTYKTDGQEMFSHPVQHIQKLAQTPSNKAAIVYV